MDERRLLIVRLSALGDIVHALPAVAFLREAFPSATIGWIVDTRYMEVLKGSPVLDRLIPLNTKEAKDGRVPAARGIVREMRGLRVLRFKTAVDFQGLIKSGMTAWLSGAPSRVGFGWGCTREYLNPLFTNRHITPPPEMRHVVLRNIHMVEEAFGLKHKGKPAFPLGFDTGEEKRVRERIQSSHLGRFAILSPGAGWTSKLWPIEGYAELGRWILREAGLGVFINFGPGEEAPARSLQTALGSTRVASFLTTIPEYIHLARHAELFVGSDSGPYHIAMAVGTRAVGIFGPSDPTRCGPWDPVNPVVWNRLECAPCFKRRCRNPMCMEKTTPAQVIGAVREALSARSTD